jgi:hypothetical protein
VLTRSPARPAWINYPQLTARAETISEVVGTARQGVRPHLVDPIVPAEDSLVLTKVRHSAFYATSVAFLLRRLETKRLVLSGRSLSSASCTPRWTHTCATFRRRPDRYCRRNRR